MLVFQIEGKEYPLKMTFQGVEHLNSLYQGGAMEVIGKAILNDLTLFKQVIHAALLHNKAGISIKQVETELENMFEQEKLTGDYIKDLLNALVVKHFFYAPIVKRIMKTDKQLTAQLEAFMQ